MLEGLCSSRCPGTIARHWYDWPLLRPRNNDEGRMAEKGHLRPWLGDIPKCPENGSPKTQIRRRFRQSRKQPKMLRAGLYARVSTNDQQTLAMQNRGMREYAARRGWTIAMQVRDVPLVRVSKCGVDSRY